MHFSRVTLTASNLDAIADYYGAVLALPVARTAEQCAVQIGRTELRFLQAAENEAPPANHLAITVPRNQFAEAKRWIEARTVTIQLDGESEFALDEPWNSDSVYFLGPDGIILEFIARHALSNESDQPFGPAGMLLVSEVGIAVPAAQRAVAALAEALGLERFAGVSASFAAVGTEDALLIVVDEGRVWFPTTDAVASAGPVHIEIADAPRAGRFDSGCGATAAASV